MIIAVYCGKGTPPPDYIYCAVRRCGAVSWILTVYCGKGIPPPLTIFTVRCGDVMLKNQRKSTFNLKEFNQMVIALFCPILLAEALA